MAVDKSNRKKVTLYHGLNEWQLRSTPDEIKRYYHKSHLNKRLANKSQHAFLETPGQVWDTEIISMKFRQNKVFPTDSAWISIERDIIHANANVINCNQSEYIITGGPVKLLSWCPNVSDNRQILAILVSHSNDSHKLEINPKENNDSIQIWDFGNSTQKNIKPKLLHSFEHQWGSITSMQWISPDEPNVEAVQKSLCINNNSPGKSQPLYGHILFCCTDGFMRICPIPKFSYDQLKGDKRKILQFSSDYILKLGLGHDFLNDGRVFFGYPTCANWNSLFPQWVVAGYSSGHIGVFDLSCVNLFHYDCVHNYLISIHKRRLSYYPIMGICISPSDWRVFNYTVDSGDSSQCNFIYKFVERTHPVVVIESEFAVKTCIWPSRADLLVSIPTIRNRVDITSIVSRKIVSVPMKGILNIASLDKDNSLLVTTESGSLDIISFNDYPIINHLMTSNISSDKIATAKTVRYYRMLNSEDSMGDNVQSLVDCLSQKEVFKLFGTASSVRYPLINAIDVNPNIAAAGWVAVGFDCGIVHLLKIGESDMLKVEEQFSAAMKLLHSSDKVNEPKVLKDVKNKIKLDTKVEVKIKKKEDSDKGKVRKSKHSDSNHTTKHIVTEQNMKNNDPGKLKTVSKEELGSGDKFNESVITPLCTDFMLVPYISDEENNVDNIILNPTNQPEGQPATTIKEDNNESLALIDVTVENLTLSIDQSIAKIDEMLESEIARSSMKTCVPEVEDVEMKPMEVSLNDAVEMDAILTIIEDTEEDFVNSIADEIAALKAKESVVIETKTNIENGAIVVNVETSEDDFVELIADEIASSTFIVGHTDEDKKNEHMAEKEIQEECLVDSVKRDTFLERCTTGKGSDNTADIDFTEDTPMVEISEPIFQETEKERNEVISENTEDNIDKVAKNNDVIPAMITEEVNETHTENEEDRCSPLKDEVSRNDEGIIEEGVPEPVVKESNKDTRIQIIFDDSDLCVDYCDDFQDGSKQIDEIITRHQVTDIDDTEYDTETNVTEIPYVTTASIVSGNIFERISKSILVVDSLNRQTIDDQKTNISAKCENKDDQELALRKYGIIDEEARTNEYRRNEIIENIHDNMFEDDLDVEGGIDDKIEVVDIEEKIVEEDIIDVEDNGTDGDNNERTVISDTVIIGNVEDSVTDENIIGINNESDVHLFIDNDTSDTGNTDKLEEKNRMGIPETDKLVKAVPENIDALLEEEMYREFNEEFAILSPCEPSERTKIAAVNVPEEERETKNESSIYYSDNTESKCRKTSRSNVQENICKSFREQIKPRSKKRLYEKLSPEIVSKKAKIDLELDFSDGEEMFESIKMPLNIEDMCGDDGVQLARENPTDNKERSVVTEDDRDRLMSEMRTAIISIERTIVTCPIENDDTQENAVTDQTSNTMRRGRASKNMKDSDAKMSEIQAVVRSDGDKTSRDSRSENSGHSCNKANSVPIKKREVVSSLTVTDNDESAVAQMHIELEITKDHETISTPKTNKRTKKSLGQNDAGFEKPPKKRKQEEEIVVFDSEPTVMVLQGPKGRDRTIKVKESARNRSSRDQSSLPKVSEPLNIKYDNGEEEDERNLSLDSTGKKTARKSKTLNKYWQTRRITVEWVEGKFRGVQQTINGKLFDEEPEVGQLSQVRWSKPTSNKKYPARVIEIIM